jgi:glucose/arabinose dehydrogenase
LRFALSGEDAGVFSLSLGGTTTAPSGSLNLGTNTGLDYEYPRDANGDNVYKVTLSVTDDVTTISQSVQVTVTNIVDTARITREASGFNDPVAYATLSINDTLNGTLGLVAERSGRILRIDNGGTITYPGIYLDLTGQVSTQPDMGILNIAMMTDGSGPRLYVLLCNLVGDTELREYRIDPINNRNILPGTERLILRVDMPDGTTANRGGLLTADINNSRLIVGIGDGAVTPSSAQNTFSLLGKILRILTDRDSFPSDPDRNYGVPLENPMVSGALGLPEIWAIGARNPRGGAFDIRSFDVYVTDIGESFDEVDRLPNPNPAPTGPINLGWPSREGLHAYLGGTDDPNFTKPIAERPHTAGSSMSGGFAYYGRTELYQGEYFFGDPVAGGLRTFVPRLAISGQTATTFTDRTAALMPNVGTINRPVAVVQDANRDLFILDGDGELFKYHATWY